MSNPSVTEASHEEDVANISVQHIIDGKNERDIPATRFIEDIEMFSSSFNPPANVQLLIGAFSDLFGKFKQIEAQLSEKKRSFEEKIPDIEKSLRLIEHLKDKKDAEESVITRYPLADTVYAKAEVDCAQGVVNLWLGANVMVEYSYEEALEFLGSKEKSAKKQLKEMTEDLAFVRNQIITCEVNISRIYNWDVRKRRIAGQ